MPKPWIDSKPEIRTLKKWEAAWLAGVVDSDGSVGLYDYGREGRRVQVQVANVCVPFLDRVRDVIGCGSQVNHVHSSSHLGKKPMFNYSLKGSCRCYWLLRQIVPYLIVKKEVAARIIREVEDRPFGRWANATKEARKRQSDWAKNSWRNPGVRARRLRGMKKHYAK
jgi:hypothetical protein